MKERTSKCIENDTVWYGDAENNLIYDEWKEARGDAKFNPRPCSAQEIDCLPSEARQ